MGFGMIKVRIMKIIINSVRFLFLYNESNNEKIIIPINADFEPEIKTPVVFIISNGIRIQFVFFKRK